MTATAAAGLIVADWPAPEGIVALTTSRLGGCSVGPYQSFNLAQHVGDNEHTVAANRQQLVQYCQGLGRIQWLNQLHGIAVAEAAGGAPVDADASVTDRPGLGCAVLTADCLPVLMCDRAGQQVAAIHAGWRGLAAGVLEATLGCFRAPPEELLAWFGPAISQPAFEVGHEVREAFLAATAADWQARVSAAFVASDSRPEHFFADLYQLARLRLQRAGLSAIYGGDRCSFNETEQFYSYRREGVTGRMASLIYKRG